LLRAHKSTGQHLAEEAFYPLLKAGAKLAVSRLLEIVETLGYFYSYLVRLGPDFQRGYLELASLHSFGKWSFFIVR
jgi:hypothetical protein